MKEIFSENCSSLKAKISDPSWTEDKNVSSKPHVEVMTNQSSVDNVYSAAETRETSVPAGGFPPDKTDQSVTGVDPKLEKDDPLAFDKASASGNDAIKNEIKKTGNSAQDMEQCGDSKKASPKSLTAESDMENTVTMPLDCGEKQSVFFQAKASHDPSGPNTGVVTGGAGQPLGSKDAKELSCPEISMSENSADAHTSRDPCLSVVVSKSSTLLTGIQSSTMVGEPDAPIQSHSGSENNHAVTEIILGTTLESSKKASPESLLCDSQGSKAVDLVAYPGQSAPNSLGIVGSSNVTQMSSRNEAQPSGADSSSRSDLVSLHEAPLDMLKLQGLSAGGGKQNREDAVLETLGEGTTGSATVEDILEDDCGFKKRPTRKATEVDLMEVEPSETHPLPLNACVQHDLKHDGGQPDHVEACKVLGGESLVEDISSDAVSTRKDHISVDVQPGVPCRESDVVGAKLSETSPSSTFDISEPGNTIVSPQNAPPPSSPARQEKKVDGLCGDGLVVDSVAAEEFCVSEPEMSAEGNIMPIVETTQKRSSENSSPFSTEEKVEEKEDKESIERGLFGSPTDREDSKGAEDLVVETDAAHDESLVAHNVQENVDRTSTALVTEEGNAKCSLGEESEKSIHGQGNQMGTYMGQNSDPSTSSRGCIPDDFDLPTSSGGCRPDELDLPSNTKDSIPDNMARHPCPMEMEKGNVVESEGPESGIDQTDMSQRDVQVESIRSDAEENDQRDVEDQGLSDTGLVCNKEGFKQPESSEGKMDDQVDATNFSAFVQDGSMENASLLTSSLASNEQMDVGQAEKDEVGILVAPEASRRFETEIQEPIDEVNHLSSASVMEERRDSGTEKPNQMSGTLGEIMCEVAVEEKVQGSSVKGPCTPLAPEEPKPEDECDHVVSAELYCVGSDHVPVIADALTTSSAMLLSEDSTRDESEKFDQEVLTASGGLGLEEDPRSQDDEIAQGSNVGSESMPRNIGPSSSGRQEEDTEVSAEKIPEELHQSAVPIEEQTLSQVALMDADTFDKGGEGMQVGNVHPEVAADEGTLNGEVMQAIQDSDIHPKVSIEESTQVGDIDSEAVMDGGTRDQGGKDTKVSIQPDEVPGNSDHLLSSSANPDENTDVKIPESNRPEVAVEENIQSEETRYQGSEDTEISSIPNKGGSVNMDLDLFSTAMPEGKMEGASQEISAEMNQSEAASDVNTEAEVDLAQGCWDQGSKDYQAGDLDPVRMPVNLGLSSVLAEEDNDGSAGKIIGEPSQSEVAVDKQIQDAGAILNSSNLDVVGGSEVPETECCGDHVDHSQASTVVPESTSVDSISVSPFSPIREGKEIEVLANTDPENASTNLVPPSSSPMKEDANIIVQVEQVQGDDTVESSEAKLEEKSEGSLAA